MVTPFHNCDYEQASVAQINLVSHIDDADEMTVWNLRVKSRQTSEQQSVPTDHGERKVRVVKCLKLTRATNAASGTPSLPLSWRLILKGVDFYISETVGSCWENEMYHDTNLPPVTGHLWRLNLKLMHFPPQAVLQRKRKKGGALLLLFRRGWL